MATHLSELPNWIKWRPTVFNLPGFMLAPLFVPLPGVAVLPAEVRKETPFFAVVWFHAPHAPVIAGQKYRNLYANFDENRQHYYGCISALDEQVGRLREALKTLNVDNNTILLFASDNGPAGAGSIREEKGQFPGGRNQGDTGGFRGRKGSLYEGGVRVPALLEWPGRFKEHQKIHLPLSTNDYYPTILSLLGSEPPGQPSPLDGINFLPLIDEGTSHRPQPIAFKSLNQRAYTDNQYKIYSKDDGQNYEMYDLLNDPYEVNDIAVSMPELLESMVLDLDEWIRSCQRSESGKDYIK